ncbi:hypothetical protein H6P81_019637 [Aristolochia fimbriata]|uniref:CCT domain-containing protein n=1 Tax=Aristolochia fimbriata TaxID=158543 RepID=A0AAV7DVG2_ARIFI|nr:hypothetical protein H6P81_019637 [Aristolochia fimbriata]
MTSLPHFVSDPEFNLPPAFWDIPGAGDNRGGVFPADAFHIGSSLLDTIWSEIDGTLPSDFQTSFPDRFGVSVMDISRPETTKLDHGGFNSCAAATANCGGFVPDFCCGYNAASVDHDHWDQFHSNSLSKNGDSTGTKVARYSVEERKGRILRYLQKRNQRNFNKTIKYACRKTLADRRRRVRGRFASNNNEIHRAEEEHHDDGTKGEDNGVDWYEQAMCIYPFLLLD